ncbi:unnamed protein product [Acanthoscelides obtectus]|uniref:Uncharacterized protein n=1 Tax=Acanthoscelides obtectus TaxID=200917 RepID=A0A9P0JLS6_ACAOB|nr:unnamed protein product [Acanthoscelides obtectus]CAK1661470.1 hypothetical protein AOBTE_LOCUS22642 [Acanthoscelides obtectus]
MNFSMTPENIGDVYVKLDVIIAGQPKSKFPVMFNLTQFGYQNLFRQGNCLETAILGQATAKWQKKIC